MDILISYLFLNIRILDDYFLATVISYTTSYITFYSRPTEVVYCI